MLRTEEISMGLDQIFVPPGTKKLSGSLVDSPSRNISYVINDSAKYQILRDVIQAPDHQMRRQATYEMFEATERNQRI
jgi:hypothetical protein